MTIMQLKFLSIAQLHPSGSLVRCALQMMAFGVLAAIGVPLPAAAFSVATGAPLTDLRPYAGQHMLLVRNAGRDAPNRIDLVLFDPASKQVKARHPTTLVCERVHLARQSIFCLGTPKARGASARAAYRVTDLALREDFAGSAMRGVTVSRARVAPNGAYAAATTFVTGHAYTLGADVFSTEALIIDLTQRSVLLPTFDLWSVMHDNKPVNARRVNFWGITFSPQDADLFYLTASLGNKAYLARGSLKNRRIDLLKADIECPSFSPDGSRLAFKKRKGLSGWVPAMLDLTTFSETVFASNRNVDDQIEWLDNHTLIYEVHTPKMAGAQTDLVLLDVRQPKSSARLWLQNAGSPAVARNSQP